MSSSKRFTIIAFITALILGVLGFYLAPYFRLLSLKLLGDIPVGVSNTDAIFRLNLLFAFTLAFFPILTALVNFVFQAKEKYSFLVPVSMFGTMILFYVVRLYNIHELLIEESEKYGIGIIMQLPIEQLQIENFLFVGAMIGGIVGAVFMKRNQKKGKI